MIFKRGEIIRHVLEKEMVDALMEEIDNWEEEEAEKGTLKPGAPSISADVHVDEPAFHVAEADTGRIGLPILK